MAETQAKPNRKLREVEFHAAEYHRIDSIAYPERGTTLEEMLVPEYWANVSGPGEETDGGKRMKAWQRIEVRPADRAWWAELLVLATGPFAAKVAVLRAVEFGATAQVADLSVPDGFETKHRGKSGWSVIRKSDGTPLKDGFESQAAAALWAIQYAKKLS